MALVGGEQPFEESNKVDRHGRMVGVVRNAGGITT
jgi:hypothetical protein